MIDQKKSDFIRSLADADGHIEPRHVVDAARDSKSPIHENFPWDVNVAAEQRWLDIARELIRFVKLQITVENHTIVAPYYVPDPERPPRSQRYVQLTMAARDRALAQQIMIDEMDRIAAAIRRAQHAAIVLDMSEWLENMLRDVTTIKTKTERTKDLKARDRKGRGKRPQSKRRSRRQPELRA